MKIIHIPFCFYPDPIGGTEVYVQSLAYHLQRQQHEIIVAAPGSHNQTYVYNGLAVRRFTVAAQISDTRELYSEGDVQSAIEFARILDEEKPDLVHLHAFTRGASLRLVRAAKQRKLPVVFTYHTPTVSCNRGTLMRWGTEVCDGQLERVRCTRCVLHSNGLNRATSTLIGTLPPGAGEILGKIGCQGGIWTALRMSELVALRHKSIRSLFDEVDHIVAVSQWIQDLLLRNHVPMHKITVCRHGLAHENELVNETNPLYVTDQLRLVFLGRLDPIKGIDIVIHALQAIPNAPVLLDIYGILQNNEATPYQTKLKALIDSDERITLHPAVAGDKVISLLRRYDMLVVPSQCLETGPLVVLEAFAAGIPVLGSKLGGTAEWVKNGVNGLLVEPNSEQAWVQALQQVLTEQTLLARLAQGITSPPSMKQVADEMLTLYRQLASESNTLDAG